MQKGKLTISIDLELAWGVWDKVTDVDLRLAEALERSICAEIVELFDCHGVPATWAMVAALLDEKSAAPYPGNVACWYAPDIVERIAKARVRHEIGSHGGRHIYFDRIDAAEAQKDLEFASALHHAHGLPFTSLVFPRNCVGHLDVLSGAGLRVFRGPDVGWTNAAQRAGTWASRGANLADKALPIPPRPVTPQAHAALINLPGSMLLLGRNGVRRFVLPAITRTKLAMGLDRAKRSGGVFHLWFHPSNFYYCRNEQLDTLAWFLQRAADEAGRGNIEIRTMGDYAASPPSAEDIPTHKASAGAARGAARQNALN